MITIITGSQGVGKTTFLQKIIERLKTKHSVGGIITPAVYANYQVVGELRAKRIKTGFDAMDLSSGEMWPLGRTGKKFAGPQFGPFSFSNKGFDKAKKVITKSLERPDDYTVLDEIGPLEYERRAGFWELLPKLSKAAQLSHLFIVVRPSLVTRTVEHYFSGVFYTIIEVTYENRMNKTFLESILRAT